MQPSSKKTLIEAAVADLMAGQQASAGIPQIGLQALGCGTPVVGTFSPARHGDCAAIGTPSSGFCILAAETAPVGGIPIHAFNDF